MLEQLRCRERQGEESRRDAEEREVGGGGGECHTLWGESEILSRWICYSRIMMVRAECERVL
jgi:hypothetical protein